MTMIEITLKRLSNTWNTNVPNTPLVTFNLSDHTLLGVICGLVGANYARPFNRNLQKYNAIFRKPWLSYPIYIAAFGCAYYGGIQLPGRLFPKLTYNKFEGVNHAYYTSSQDIVSKFRMFDTFEEDDTRSDIINYLTAYSNKPLTKTEMIDNIALNALKEFDLGKMFRIKRMGKDKDDIFWSFGKIHGLENIAFVDPKELEATGGNPVKI